MAIDFKSPEQIADEYLLHLKALRPDIDDKLTDSDWWVKSRVIGGVVSGIYSDIRKVADDAFPQSARREAVGRMLDTYLNDTFKDPTKSNGEALFTGATGSFAAAGSVQMVYVPNGNTYVNTEDITLVEASGAVAAIQSIGTGQIQNLLEGASLKLSAPPGGFDNAATVYGADLADGADLETTEEAAARVLARIRESVRGGTSEDYRQWALEADDAVRSANILRYPQGFGSVGIIISAGTTDIDTALDNGQPIVLVPSQALVDIVQAYIDTKRPLTDYAIVYKPNETLVDVTVQVRFLQGNKDTILAGQTLTQGELVEREIKRAVYKTPAGGRRLGASGYVVKSDLDEVLDIGLSGAPNSEGTVPILADRYVQDLTASGYNRLVLDNEIAVPGVVTVVEL